MLYALGVKVANFMYLYDTYECWDSFGTREETQVAICDELNTTKGKQGIMDKLKEIAEDNNEDFGERIQAAQLYREVNDYVR